MSELIDTTEMYLKTVYELEEDGVPPLRARIVERLDHSGPTVSQTVSRMERDGLIRVGEGRALELTEEGRRKAVDVIRKHRLAERLLLDVIGLDRSLIHEEACRWEHVMSEQVEDRLTELLGTVQTDPFGNTIPERDQVRPCPAASEISADRAAREGEVMAKVKRVGEPIQADAELIKQVERAGVIRGAEVTVRPNRQGVQIIAADGVQVVLPADMARHVFLAR